MGGTPDFVRRYRTGQQQTRGQAGRGCLKPGQTILRSTGTAVMLKPDETVVLSWIPWPDKATRDAGMAKVMTDPEMSDEANPMPFDGQRLIYGGFEVLAEY